MATVILGLDDAGVPREFRTDENGRPAGYAELFGRTQLEIATGEGTILDVRGSRGFVVILNGSTATKQPCNSAGEVVPGSASAAVVDSVLNDPNWSHFKVVRTGAAVSTGCVV